MRCDSADNPGVRFDLAHPTPSQVREGLISGLIAESVMVPVLVCALLLGDHPVRWGFMGAAFACFFASVVYLAFVVALTKGHPGIGTQANMGFVMVCLSMTALGFMALASESRFGAFTPAVLVGVTFVSSIGDHRMRVTIAGYAMALVAIISTAEGLRGTALASVVIVYATTIVAITWIVARTVGVLSGTVNFRTAIDALNETFAGPDPGDAESSTEIVRRAFERGLPLVTDVLPARSVLVFARSGKHGRYVPLVTWQADPQQILDLAELPELAQALRADAPVVTDRHCAIPIGFCAEGELVMVVCRADGDARRSTGADEAAGMLAAAFLRVTSRANFVSGLHAESRTDPLTGLANRRSMFERIEMEMAHALRRETPLSMAMIDLDHFKLYNDEYGHVAGDTLLRSIAAVMVSNIRGQDLVARYGGEEFCLIMPDTDLVGGHHLLEILRNGGRDSTSEFPVTLSAGLTSWDGVEDTTSFIERADQALYRAKETGRNRVVSIQAFTEF
jgi:diguanylate cyclase (GGDEF)-like protein